MLAATPALFRIALLALTAAVPAAATTPSAPLAIVAAVKGRVEVVSPRGGSPSRVSAGRTLAREDRLTVTPGGAVTIFFNDGNVVELGEKSSMTIGGRAATRSRTAAGSELSPEIYSSVAKFVTVGSRQTGLVALTPLRGGSTSSPLLIEPRRTELLDGHPRFRWRPVEGAIRYRVSVSNEQGELWHRELADTLLEYPTDVGMLSPDVDYTWEVQGVPEQSGLRREESSVHVIAEGNAASVREALQSIRESAGGSDNDASFFLAGSYLFGQGLYIDSARQFESLGRLTPDSPAPHEALGNIYQAIGLMDLAASEYQRALALTRRP